jgi:hypothetical protein
MLTRILVARLADLRESPCSYPGERRRGARPGGWVGGSRGAIGGSGRVTGASVISSASPWCVIRTVPGARSVYSARARVTSTCRHRPRHETENA